MEISSYMAMNLSSIQQAVSASMLRKAINSDAAAVSTLLSDFSAANPASAAPSAHRLDVRA